MGIPKLQCPVCNLSVPEKFLNIHLDKCLKSGEDEVRSVPKQKSIKKHLINEHEEDDTTEDELEDDLDLSQEETNTSIQLKPSVPSRTQHKRSVVRPPIVESQSAKEVVTDEQVIQEPPLSPPSSPIYDKYTETISQSQGSNKSNNVPPSFNSEKDFFEESDDDDGVSNVSGSLLDLDKHLDNVMEEIFQDEERISQSDDRNGDEDEVNEEVSSRESSTSQRKSRRKAGTGSKNVSLTVVPKTRRGKTKASSSQDDKPTNDDDNEENEVRTTRRKRTKKT